MRTCKVIDARNVCAILVLALLFASFAACTPAMKAASTPAQDDDAKYFTAMEPTGSDSETVVSTVDELLAAIGPDRKVYLNPGVYTLSDASNYGMASGSEYYCWLEESDGYGLCLTGVKGLTLQGHSANDVEINTLPRYANVLSVLDSSNIAISGITAGHVDGFGTCSGAVLYLEAVDGASVQDSVLYGCGILGLSLSGSKDVKMENCTVKECSIGAVSLLHGENVLITDCRLRNNGTSDSLADAVLYTLQSNGVAVVNCTITQNNSSRLLTNSYSKDVQILSTRVQGNTFYLPAVMSEQYSPVIAGCSFSDNDNVDWVAAVTDAEVPCALPVSLDGATLSSQDLERMQFESIPYTPPKASSDTPAAATAGEDGMIHVSTVDEFLAAIGSDRTVYLEDGDYDLSTASNYGAVGTDSYYWTENFDGPGLTITGVSNFSITGSGADAVSFTAIPRYANVLTFEWCDHISVTNITFGHLEGPGTCSGGVLSFNQTSDVEIKGCSLYGCGIYGVEAYGCRSFVIDNTEIYDCSICAVSLMNSSDFAFTQCNIHDCGEPMFKLCDCESVTRDGEALKSYGQ